MRGGAQYTQGFSRIGAKKNQGARSALLLTIAFHACGSVEAGLLLQVTAQKVAYNSSRWMLLGSPEFDSSRQFSSQVFNEINDL